MKHLVFLIPPDVLPGFSLAGFREQVCDAAELKRTLRELMDEEQVGVIVVDERLLGQFGADDLHGLKKKWTGILMVLPPPGAEEVVQEDYALQLIQKAIGYHVRLEL